MKIIKSFSGFPPLWTGRGTKIFHFLVMAFGYSPTNLCKPLNRPSGKVFNRLSTKEIVTIWIRYLNTSVGKVLSWLNPNFNSITLTKSANELLFKNRRLLFSIKSFSNRNMPLNSQSDNDVRLLLFQERYLKFCNLSNEPLTGNTIISFSKRRRLVNWGKLWNISPGSDFKRFE